MGLQPSGSNNHGIPITQMQAFQAMMGKVRRTEPGGEEEGVTGWQDNVGQVVRQRPLEEVTSELNLSAEQIMNLTVSVSISAHIFFSRKSFQIFVLVLVASGCHI